MSDKRTSYLQRALAVATAAVLLAACSSSVVRENSSSSASHRIDSKPKYGASAQVQRGDTLYGVAFRNGIDFRDLAAWNGIGAPYTIYPGQSLRLYPPDGKTVAATSASSATTIRPKPLSVPIPARPVATSPSVPPVNSGVSWRWPADGAVIGRFGAGDATKQGVDIAGTSGQPVRAAGDGVVVYSGGGLVGYGELVIIKHNEAWLSAYGHNRTRLVNEGQNVKAGQQIAELGRSGAARDMLHFEIRYNGKPVDPQLYLPKR
ncbi:MAG: peptidoglycan DD-metalloendopeptidase family protein [Pseudoxanthomonas sp.]